MPSEYIRACRSWCDHRFEPRYSHTETTSGTDINIQLQVLLLRDLDLANLLKLRTMTYEGDVCSRCGTAINRRTAA